MNPEKQPSSVELCTFIIQHWETFSCGSKRKTPMMWSHWSYHVSIFHCANWLIDWLVLSIKKQLRIRRITLCLILIRLMIDIQYWLDATDAQFLVLMSLWRSLVRILRLLQLHVEVSKSKKLNPQLHGSLCGRMWQTVVKRFELTIAL